MLFDDAVSSHTPWKVKGGEETLRLDEVVGVEGQDLVADVLSDTVKLHA